MLWARPNNPPTVLLRLPLVPCCGQFENSWYFAKALKRLEGR